MGKSTKKMRICSSPKQLWGGDGYRLGRWPAAAFQRDPWLKLWNTFSGLPQLEVGALQSHPALSLYIYTVYIITIYAACNLYIYIYMLNIYLHIIYIHHKMLVDCSCEPTYQSNVTNKSKLLLVKYHKIADDITARPLVERLGPWSAPPTIRRRNLRPWWRSVFYFPCKIWFLMSMHNWIQLSYGNVSV